MMNALEAQKPKIEPQAVTEAEAEEQDERREDEQEVTTAEETPVETQKKQAKKKAKKEPQEQQTDEKPKKKTVTITIPRGKRTKIVDFKVSMETATKAIIDDVMSGINDVHVRSKLQEAIIREAFQKVAEAKRGGTLRVQYPAIEAEEIEL